MIYITAQIFGFMATACCLIGPLFKYKWQILVNSAVANLLVALNFFLLGEVVEFDNTDKLFSMPSDKRTEDYITGRFG